MNGVKMRKLVVFAAAAATMGTAFVTPSSATPPPPGGPVGRKCAFNSTTDVTREAGWQTGQINAGPLVTGEDGRLVCSIHVNNNRHDGAELVTEYGTTVASAVAYMEVRPLNYQATAADDIALCTRWEGASGTLYWRGGNTATGDLGSWETSPATECGKATSIEPNDPECSIWKAIDRRLGTNIAEIWQDCEPYEEFPLPI